MVVLPAGLHASGLIDPITRAFKSDRVTELALVLAEMARSGALDDPALFAASRDDRYARRLIWRDPGSRFVVIGMTWAPRQGSPLHDHMGLLGAEIVVSGTMRERTYRLLDRDREGRHLFAPGSQTLHGRGSVGTLIPPLEYHEFANAGDCVARTVHVYGGDLDRCSAFAAESGGWWRPKAVELRYDA